jgi:hypothetical protein
VNTTIRASARQKIIAVVMLVAALVYLTHFVSRGWIPHDEGMLGQSAERVLLGQIPHVDYEEPYTGGLSWVYAGVFRIGGVELLHVRWLVFGVAVVAVLMLYVLLRQFLEPFGAAVGAWVGLTWSFPNYLVGLPSWWLTLCALCCIWAMVRYVERRELRYVVVAGVSAGTALAFKQTGLYLLIALVLFLAYDTTTPFRFRWYRRIVVAAAAAFPVLVVASMFRPRLISAEGLYLVSPIAACSAALLYREYERSWTATAPSTLRTWSLACAAALVPLGALVLPYLLDGHLREFLYGAFVLPRRRFIFATLFMPSAYWIFAGVPFVALVLPFGGSRSDFFSRVLIAVMWLAALLLPIWALWNPTVYRVIWHSSRGVAVVTPIAICYRLVRGHVETESKAAVLYGVAAVLAWMSLNQFPFAGPIYFSYTTPLAIIAVVALAASSGSLRPPVLLPWAVMLLLFATLSSNRSYVQQLGLAHVPRHFDTPLNLPRAHLSLEANDVSVYRRTVALIEQHLTNGPLIAGPDAPILYYLVGAQSQSGKLFDFFSDSPSTTSGTFDEWSKGQVIAVNHRPLFSTKLSPELLAHLRRKFPEGEQIGEFEVRWR